MLTLYLHFAIIITKKKKLRYISIQFWIAIKRKLKLNAKEKIYSTGKYTVEG